MWFDRVLKSVGLQRRKRSTIGAQWSAARQNRLLLDWVWQHLSADKEVQGSLPILRGRCRELVINDAFAKRYVRMLVKNIIGRGIQLQARLMKGTNPNDELNDTIEAAWRLWGQRANATTDRRLSWRGVQRVAIKSVGTDGEFFARIVRGFDNPFGFALQLLDPDQLDVSYNVPPAPGRNEIRMSVEVNEWGEPVAFHFWKGHPSELSKPRERERIPAADIIHLYDPDRVNQTRGIPPLSPVALDLHMLRGYYEAELVAARVAAAKQGFLVNKDDTGGAAAGPEVGELTMDAEPGLLEQLPPGWEFQGWNPEHPTSAFPDFSKAILHKAASGLDVSYAGLTNDLADTSYSSSRVGLLDERDSYREMQDWVIEGLHQRVYTAWLGMAMVTGHLPARVRLVDYQLVDWVARGWDWVDPEKDITASLLEVDNALNSRRRILAAQGLDLEDVVEDLVAEEELFRRKGLLVGRRPLPGRAPEPAAPPARDSAQAALEQVATHLAELAGKPAAPVNVVVHSPDVHAHTHIAEGAVQVDVAAPDPAKVDVHVESPPAPAAGERELVFEDGEGHVVRRARLLDAHRSGRPRVPEEQPA